MSAAQWPPPWIRAALRLAILGCLVDADRHGYAISNKLAARGFGKIAGGSLYPHLLALEEAGFVAATWLPAESGPARKQYRLTTAGREHLIAELAHVDDLAANLRAPLNAPATATSATASPATEPSHA